MTPISVENVWKFFGDYPALREVSFKLESSSCLALLGRNGAGKTTMLRILAGLSSASKGAVNLPDRRRTSYLGHNIGIYDELSAYENLKLFARFYEVDNPASVASKWLERVNLAHVADSPAREFSRGMRQRLALGRVFLHEPEMLLLDEPFTSLDDKAIALLQDLMREAKSRGATIILSTHQLREALELATNVVLLRRGQIAYCGPRTQSMVDDPAALYRDHGGEP